ncbi:hypothetical protein B7494_g6262 [Chlorociboria aeruginascens]|nr:hypothetical protein B7494_g6262 [Chlorociboria aeruginascens]
MCNTVITTAKGDLVDSSMISASALRNSSTTIYANNSNPSIPGLQPHFEFDVPASAKNLARAPPSTSTTLNNPLNSDGPPTWKGWSPINKQHKASARKPLDKSFQTCSVLAKTTEKLPSLPEPLYHRHTGFTPLIKQAAAFETFLFQRPLLEARREGGEMYLLRQLSTPEQRKKLTEFTIFSKLPPELQLSIWKLAVPGPRMITIRASADVDTFRPSNLLDTVGSLVSVPALLHTNSDSRSVALKVFEKRFASQHPFGYTFLNFNIDTLSFDLQTAKRLAMTEDTRLIADRNLIQNVEVRFKLVPTIEICDAIASVVITGQVRSWPSIKTWSFPGTEPMKATLIELMFARTSNDKDAEAIVPHLALVIKAAFDENLNKGAPAVAFKFSRVDNVPKGAQAM